MTRFSMCSWAYQKVVKDWEPGASPKSPIAVDGRNPPGGAPGINNLLTGDWCRISSINRRLDLVEPVLKPPKKKSCKGWLTAKSDDKTSPLHRRDQDEARVVSLVYHLGTIPIRSPDHQFPPCHVPPWEKGESLRFQQ